MLWLKSVAITCCLPEASLRLSQAEPQKEEANQILLSQAGAANRDKLPVAIGAAVKKGRTLLASIETMQNFWFHS